jgi:hypothetical protein
VSGASPGEACRLYELRDGRAEVISNVSVTDGLSSSPSPVEGAAGTSWYWVDESDPWADFERHAGLEDAHWGPCRAPSAGI